MTSELSSQLTQLTDLIATQCATTGESTLHAGDAASLEMVAWLNHLRSTSVTGTADSLIDATLSTARESITCITLGLVRPALNSIRLQMDLALAWLYFKDHPVEWERVQQTGDGYKLKTELVRYLQDTRPKFSTRFGLLAQCATRSIEDPYRLLSAHVHGQSAQTFPQIKLLKDVVASSKSQTEAIELQGACSEYISDTFWSFFADKWAAIPDPLRQKLEARFKSQKMRAAFFA